MSVYKKKYLKYKLKYLNLKNKLQGGTSPIDYNLVEGLSQQKRYAIAQHMGGNLKRPNFSTWRQATLIPPTGTGLQDAQVEEPQVEEPQEEDLISPDEEEASEALESQEEPEWVSAQMRESWRVFLQEERRRIFENFPDDLYPYPGEEQEAQLSALLTRPDTVARFLESQNLSNNLIEPVVDPVEEAPAPS